MLIVDSIAKKFGSVVAVRDVSFVARPGEVTAVLGPNGAGKTTALRMIAGLIRPDSGHIQIDGIDVLSQGRRARARLGVLPDARGLYPRLTAAEHLQYYGRLQGLDETTIDERTQTLAQALEMTSVLHRRVSGFSQGEGMKLALARALIHEPSCVLLDEPTNGLDVMSTRAVRRMIHELKMQGRTVVFSSHVMSEVAELCDTIVVVIGGRVLSAGTTDELCEQWQCETLEDAFVACIESQTLESP
ncbi:MAG TPA: ABC transporter [Myxococcales bacterium]|nr:ABC transporter [Myxococcales bacterium]